MNISSNKTIQKNALLKQSFFKLAKDTYEIDLQAWDQLGFWDSSYNVHCIERQNQISANISTSVTTLLLNGQTFSAQQIGHAMTDTRHHQKGDVTALMNHLIDANKKFHYLFLFANRQSASFYEQFGFELISQKRFSIETATIQFKQTEIKKLDFNDEKTREFLLDLLIHRLPTSTQLGVLQNEMIVMLQIMARWKEHLYYLPSLQTVVIGRQDSNAFVLADFISKQPILLKELLPYLNVSGQTIQLGFTPSSMHGMTSEVVKGDYFYVKNQCDTPFPANYYFPDLARA